MSSVAVEDDREAGLDPCASAIWKENKTHKNVTKSRIFFKLNIFNVFEYANKSESPVFEILNTLFAREARTRRIYEKEWEDPCIHRGAPMQFYFLSRSRAWMPGVHNKLGEGSMASISMGYWLQMACFSWVNSSQVQMNLDRGFLNENVD
jgi:hypothetical protein